jgi:hypothetical protein
MKDDLRIFRDFTLSRMSDKASGEFLRALAQSGGCITCCFTNASQSPSYRTVSMYFRLRFIRQEHLDRFHSLGYETTEPPKISLN